MQDRKIDLKEGPDLIEMIKAQRERCKTLVEIAESSRYFYQAFADYDQKAVKKNFKPGTDKVLQRLVDEFSQLSSWHREKLHQIVLDTAVIMELKLGKVAQPLRVAILGVAVSPAIDVTLLLLGREKTLSRLVSAIEYIKERDLHI